ncbi:hypothetical protein Lalb_Chr18g0049501 [Lupinus albus]|uniref:Uncharacterized protein n=1 Tax=Lupinus albus TaxID=3870 RepID=A0A6A4NY02_LUPAL|nr:hypothetical protein Lalb_Chr18g0049501 [Lupinus albus]
MTLLRKATMFFMIILKFLFTIRMIFGLCITGFINFVGGFYFSTMTTQPRKATMFFMVILKFIFTIRLIFGL